LHEDAGRHHHEHEAPAPERVGRGRDGDVGLPRPGDRLHQAAPATAPTTDQRVELPAIERATLDADVAEHESAPPESEHGRYMLPATPALRAPCCPSGPGRGASPCT